VVAVAPGRWRIPGLAYYEAKDAPLGYRRGAARLRRNAEAMRRELASLGFAVVHRNYESESESYSKTQRRYYLIGFVRLLNKRKATGAGNENLSGEVECWLTAFRK